MPRFYREQGGRLRERSWLWEALALEEIPHAVISLVGAGGKTSTMYQLARECRDMGRRVLVSTSTHIACPQEYPVVVIQQAEQLKETWAEDELPAILVVAGAKDERNNKLAGMPVSELEKLSAYCDVLLIEADGSKRLPLKICAEHEPVICDATQVVIGCVGLSAVGQRWEDACFRWKTVENRWLWKPEDGRTVSETHSAAKEHEGEKNPVSAVIQPEQVARILMNERWGTRKYVDGREYRIVLNQMDDKSRQKTAEQLVEYLNGYIEEESLVIAASSYL